MTFFFIGQRLTFVEVWAGQWFELLIAHALVKGSCLKGLEPLGVQFLIVCKTLF